MNYPSLCLLFKLALALSLITIYLFLVYLASHSGGTDTVISTIRHVILITGLVPLCAWLIVIFWAKRSTLLKLVLFAFAVTLFHWFLFAVSAHYDGLLYWGLQTIELVMLASLLRVAGIKLFEAQS